MVETVIRSLGVDPGEMLEHLAKNAPEAFFRALMFCRNDALTRKNSDDYLVQEVYRRSGKIIAIRVCMRIRGLSLHEANDYVGKLTDSMTPTTVDQCHGA